MILAEKIIKLRKKIGWSQEDLAEKLNVSRQSVSKWESASSIPDLNKIITLADLFGVSTDYLLKDNVEESGSIGEDREPGKLMLTLEEAMKFVESKIEQSKYISTGVLLCIYSVVPLFFFQAFTEGEHPRLNPDVSSAIGLVILLATVAFGVSLFLRSSRYKRGVHNLEEQDFELAYGVQGAFSEKLEQYQNFYLRRISLSVSMMILSVVPLILVSLFSESYMALLMMVVLMFVIIGAAVYMLIPSVMEHGAYNLVLGEGDYSPSKRMENRRSEKLGAFYWPLVTALYIGWSLWTQDWHITWIVWPVAGIAFTGLVGLMGLVNREDVK